MEYLDIVDEKGKPVGRKKLRREVHGTGDLHKTVHIWVVNFKNEILLQKRGPAKETYPGKWDISSAGHIKAGENSLNSAVKELKEELGIEISPADLKYLFTIRTRAVLNRETFIDNEISDIYLFRRNVDIKELCFPNKEVSEVSFMPLKRLKEHVAAFAAAFVPHEEEYQKLFACL